jgi:hypothetical protein
MAALGHQQSCFAQAPQHAANDHRICARMRGDIGRLAHAVRVSGHMSKGVKSQ